MCAQAVNWGRAGARGNNNANVHLGEGSTGRQQHGGTWELSSSRLHLSSNHSSIGGIEAEQSSK